MYIYIYIYRERERLRMALCFTAAGRPRLLPAVARRGAGGARAARGRPRG